MVAYNPGNHFLEELISAVHANLDGLSAEGASAGKTIVIPVCYGGEFGPDLEHVAQFHGITPMKWCACTPSPVPHRDAGLPAGLRLPKRLF